MTGAFKDLNRSDIYLTEHDAIKKWKVQESEFRDLKISKFYANSGPQPIVDEPVWKGKKAYYVKSTERKPIYQGDVVECRLSEDPNTYLYFESGSYFPTLSYRELDIEYYRATNRNTFKGSFTGSYDNTLQSTITIEGAREISDRLLVYSIPRSCTGLKLIPETILITSNTGNTYSDKEGVLLDRNLKIGGDVIYNRGLIIVTDSEVIRDLAEKETLDFNTVSKILTHNILCTVRDSEFNYTYNPTLKELQTQDKVVTPYITSVGLYNSRGELIAVAKLSKPIKKDANVDMTIRIQIDT